MIITSAMSGISGGSTFETATAAATVSPPYAAISACGTLPTPLYPLNVPCASVETLAAPPTCALSPSPGCSRAWSLRAPK